MSASNIIDDIRESINVCRTNIVKEPEWFLLSRVLYESLPFKCNAVLYGDGVVSVNGKELLDKLEKEYNRKNYMY